MNPIAQFLFISNEPFVSFECALDSPTYGSCPSDGQFIDLLVGTHTLRVRAVDSGGNVDPTPEVYRWTVGPMPDTFIVAGPEEVTQETTAEFTFGSNLPGVHYECSIGEAAENLFFLPCTNPLVLEDLVFGEHEILVRAVDAAGNVDPIPAEWSWEIGGIPPPVLIETGPDVTTDSRSAQFTFSAAGSNLTICARSTAPSPRRASRRRRTTACRSARTPSR